MEDFGPRPRVLPREFGEAGPSDQASPISPGQPRLPDPHKLGGEPLSSPHVAAESHSRRSGPAPLTTGGGAGRVSDGAGFSGTPVAHRGQGNGLGPRADRRVWRQRSGAKLPLAPRRRTLAAGSTVGGSASVERRRSPKPESRISIDPRPYSRSLTSPATPLIRDASDASRNRSMSPSSTAPELPVSTPVRRSFTI